MMFVYTVVAQMSQSVSELQKRSSGSGVFCSLRHVGSWALSSPSTVRVETRPINDFPVF